MKINENLAISTPRVLLVPYDPHHVATYHGWMSDPEIQAATASEPLTLEEEHSNQLSWRTSTDKLTFIICQPMKSNATDNKPPSVPTTAVAGRCDVPSLMIGDVNIFFHPWQPEDEDGDEDRAGNGNDVGEVPGYVQARKRYYVDCEIDIMIADPNNRGKGIGKGAVATLLCYIIRNLAAILAEYFDYPGVEAGSECILHEFGAKIQASNHGSQALFKSLGFQERGEEDFFGELELVLEDWSQFVGLSQDYSELEYRRL